MVFDAEVRREAAGGFRLDYPLRAGDKEVHLQLEFLRLLQRLPLKEPERMVFGFRVADARPDVRGRWLIAPEPDSGVLLTEPDVFTGTSVPADEALKAVLRKQAEWAEGM
jgi:hypothetical protein